MQEMVTTWRAGTLSQQGSTVQLVLCRKVGHVFPEPLLFQEKVKKIFFM